MLVKLKVSKYLVDYLFTQIVGKVVFCSIYLSYEHFAIEKGALHLFKSRYQQGNLHILLFVIFAVWSD